MQISYLKSFTLFIQFIVSKNSCTTYRIKTCVIKFSTNLIRLMNCTFISVDLRIIFNYWLNIFHLYLYINILSYFNDVELWLKLAHCFVYSLAVNYISISLLNSICSSNCSSRHIGAKYLCLRALLTVGGGVA